MTRSPLPLLLLAACIGKAPAPDSTAERDSGSPDSGTADSGSPDSGSPDSGSPDSAPADTHDSGADTGEPGDGGGVDARTDLRIEAIDDDQYLGWALEVADANGDGNDDLWFGVPGYGRGEGVYLLEGPVTGPVTLASHPTWKPVADDAWTGRQIDASGDLDGDGVADLVVGAAMFEGVGLISVVSGSGASGGDLADADASLSTTSGDAFYVYELASGGDYDGDGIDDLLWGAPEDEDTESAEGAAHLILGPLTGEMDETDIDFSVYSGRKLQDFGAAVASLGDTDGDGLDDFAIGAPSEGSNAGEDYAAIGLGPVSGTITAADLDALYISAANYTDAGRAVAGADMNGDGYADTIVGAPYRTGAPDGVQNGSAYVLYSPPSSRALEDADLEVIGGEGAAYLGQTVSAEDVDQDGTTDLIAASQHSFGGTWNGVVVLLFDPGTGSRVIGPGAEGVSFVGALNDELGGAVAVGDLNGDGDRDLIIGSPSCYNPYTLGGAIDLAWGDTW